MARLAAAFLIAFSLSASLAEGFSYPALDTASQWTLQDWGADPELGFHVRGASKRVWTGPGQSEERTVFYDLACVGVEIDGARRALGPQDYTGGFEGEGYFARYGSFQVTPGVGLVAIFYFHDDGRFRMAGFLNGDGVGSISSWKLLVRADYDMAGSGDDLAEFAWSKASEGRSASPPQYPADGRLRFEPGGPAYWSASGHEITVEYPPISPEAGPGIENAGFARITDAAHPRFGMILWGDGRTSVAATFKAYASFNGDLEPAADVSEPLESVEEAPGYPRYAFAGRDQMAWLALGGASPWEACNLSGKLFQRPDSRPLAVTVHQHPPEYMGGWNFDPDAFLMVKPNETHSFREALADLAGPRDLAIARSGDAGIPYLPFDGYASPGQSVTEAQLHDLMTASRDYGSASLENVRDWRLDLYVVDWILQGDPDVWEAMFDYGDADANGIAREGAAVFWPALRGHGEDWRRRQAGLSALRGLGLALNMDPSWGACPSAGFCWDDPSTCGGSRCGTACPPGAPNCRYEAYTCVDECVEGSIMSLTDADHSTLRFNPAPAAGSARSEIDWYRGAPEAWAKPGRFGIGPVSGPMPAFTPE